ncbi:MAG: hypothetical protein DRQ40_03835 [Gammaproteobacteria bacterium]|nr:MAG: hypothetical protein DRQ40_03835 [Gammaproteobacteria bacterium]
MKTETLNLIQAAAQTTWEAIAPDIISAIEADTVDREIVIEAVLDAGRIERFSAAFLEPELTAALVEFRSLAYCDQIAIMETVFTFSSYG